MNDLVSVAGMVQDVYIDVIVSMERHVMLGQVFVFVESVLRENYVIKNVPKEHLDEIVLKHVYVKMEHNVIKEQVAVYVYLVILDRPVNSNVVHLHTDIIVRKLVIVQKKHLMVVMVKRVNVVVNLVIMVIDVTYHVRKADGGLIVCINVIVMEVHAILKRDYAIVHLVEWEFDVNKIVQQIHLVLAVNHVHVNHFNYAIY